MFTEKRSMAIDCCFYQMDWRQNMNWLKNIFKKIGRNVIIYGETKTGHTFPSYEKYLEYKIKQQ